MNRPRRPTASELPFPFNMRREVAGARGGPRQDAVRGWASSRHEAPSVALADSLLVQFLRDPAMVGGIVPSSAALARAMSRHAAGFEAIVELGAGTGAVTRQLAADHPRAALWIIEREPALARRLATACARARLCLRCVHECEDELLAQPARAVAVSSLPFRSLPVEVAATTIATLERFLLAHPARRLVQYSYGLRAPFAFADDRLAWRRAARVWRNVPPAVVWLAELGPGAGEC